MIPHQSAMITSIFIEIGGSSFFLILEVGIKN